MREEMREMCLLIPCWQKFVLCFGSVFISSVVLFSWIDYEVQRPELPEYQIDSAALTQLEVTGRLGQPELTVMLELTVLVVNPNVKLNLDFCSLEVMLFYKMMKGDSQERFLLAAKPVSPYFFMPTKTNTTVSFKLSTSPNTFVDQDRVSKPISEAKDGGGSVKFEIRMLARWKYRSDSYNLGGLRYSKLDCGLLEFTLDDPNTTATTWSAVNFNRSCKRPPNEYCVY